MALDAMKKELSQGYVVLSHGVPAEHAGGKAMPVKVPEKHFRDCYGVVIFVEYELALVVGAAYGYGVIIKKINKGAPDEKWSAPVPFTITGAQVGASAGYAKSEFILFLTSVEQMTAFEKYAQLDLTAEAIGTGDTEEQLRDGMAGRLDVKIGGAGKGSGILYGNSSGAMVSASLGTSVLIQDHEKLKRAYGKDASAQKVLNGELGMEAAYADPIMAAVYNQTVYKKQETKAS
ncbi:SH3 domain-containing protein [Porphyridium purpureum]|uniref:SH3 domain-containing protein n=1 Tax=Porphyridium purpureum TaxID=35688 RepID=A0A5J4YPG8_PORPP|nr:SH3 domain-containing protein [Porphyridium purpureum]|eukprot:POR9133..scf249_10